MRKNKFSSKTKTILPAKYGGVARRLLTRWWLNVLFDKFQCVRRCKNSVFKYLRKSTPLYFTLKTLSVPQVAHIAVNVLKVKHNWFILMYSLSFPKFYLAPTLKFLFFTSKSPLDSLMFGWIINFGTIFFSLHANCDLVMLSAPIASETARALKWTRIINQSIMFYG